MQRHLLGNYSLLQDYCLLATVTSAGSPVACIANTRQLVALNKTPYAESLLGRFEALVGLHEAGVVLTDSMFILDEGQGEGEGDGGFMFYVVQAYTGTLPLMEPPPQCPCPDSSLSLLSEIAPAPRYSTLHSHINSPHYPRDPAHRLSLLNRVKILLQCVHSRSQFHGALTTKAIIVDTEHPDDLYLAPYPLQLRVQPEDRYSCAYYPPQMLRMGEGGQIGYQAMLRCDMWAYGCVAMEVLGFCAPVFMAGSDREQLRLIEESMAGDYLDECLRECIREYVGEWDEKVEAMLTLISNCLAIDPQERVFSTAKQQKNNRLPRIDTNTKTSAAYNQPTDNHDSQLLIQVLHLSHLHLQKQLRLNLHLARKHSIFVSPSPHTHHLINKTIKVTDSWEHLVRLVQRPLVVEIEAGGERGRVEVGVGALRVLHGGRRVWGRPIEGTYWFGEGGFAGVGVRLRVELRARREGLGETDGHSFKIVGLSGMSQGVEKRVGSKDLLPLKQLTPPTTGNIPQAQNPSQQVNQILQQISQKPKPATDSQTSKDDQISIPCSRRPKCPQQGDQVQMPSSVESSHVHKSTVDDQIVRKIREIGNRFGIRI